MWNLRHVATTPVQALPPNGRATVRLVRFDGVVAFTGQSVPVTDTWQRFCYSVPTLTGMSTASLDFGLEGGAGVAGAYAVDNITLTKQ